MFTPHHYSNVMPWPRPFVAGFVLLLLFLSLFGDSPASHDQRQSIQQAAPQTKSEDGLKKGVKEQIIYDLSVTNERLENEVHRLKQYILDVRRAARKAGCTLEDNSILTLYPELHDEIQEEEGSDEKAEKKSSSKNSSEDGEGIDVDENFNEEGPTSNDETSIHTGSRKLRRRKTDGNSDPGTSENISSSLNNP